MTDDTTIRVPDGYALVPIEPTEAMLSAARDAPIPLVQLDSQRAREDMVARARWTAMINAARAKPSAQVVIIG